MVAGGLPPPPNEAEMRERARQISAPMDRTGPKLRWTAGEMEAMAVAEDRLLGAHLAGRGTNVNIKLQKQFPERTLEAIKGMRRLPK